MNTATSITQATAGARLNALAKTIVELRTRVRELEREERDTNDRKLGVAALFARSELVKAMADYFDLSEAMRREARTTLGAAE